MPLILCHSPKGGVGTSFVAAGLAQGLSMLGRDVVALDMTAQDSLKLYFGIAPEQRLPDFDDANFDGQGLDQVVVNGVLLRSGWRAAHQLDFADVLLSGDMPFTGETIYVADVASADVVLAQLLRSHARLHVCPLTPTAMALAQMPRISPGRTLDSLTDTAFVLNQLDETRRFARHAALFLRELLGSNLVAQIHRDEAVNEAVGMQQTLARYSPSSAALTGLAQLVAIVDDRCTAPAADGDTQTVAPRASAKPAKPAKSTKSAAA
jgi:cellulose biosynthesis protein BcsQ